MEKRSWMIGLIVPLFMSCGSGAEVAEGPQPIEKVEENENGTVEFETFMGADPDMAQEMDRTSEEMTVEGDAEAIEWLDFETAIDRNQEDRRFIFIDMYTDWCGWCRKMDATTFKNPSVINYIDQNFHAVKMNPESKEAVAYKEVLYESKMYGKKMYNELAVNLMGGKMTFPSFVILNKREVKRGIIPGYQTPNQLLSALRHYVE